MKPLTLIWSGLLIPVRGMTLISANRRIRRLAILPFIVAALILIVGLAWGLPFVTGLVGPFTDWVLTPLAKTSGAREALSWILPILIWPPLALCLLYFLWLVIRVISAPFYSLLAERVLVEAGGRGTEVFRLLPWLSQSMQMTLTSLGRAGVMGVFGICLFLVSFIPGIGAIAAIGVLMLIAADICDYALEALGWKLRKRLQFLRKHWPLLFGFGLALGLVFLVPGLNFFLLPSSVAGASDTVNRLAREESADRRPHGSRSDS